MSDQSDESEVSDVPVEPVPGTHPGTLWPGLDDPQFSLRYVDRFHAMRAQGQDIEGESRLADVLAPRRSRLLDAGCGPGRHAAYLAGAGHQVVGVDIDPLLIDAARRDHPASTWLVGDLTTLDLPARGHPGAFDGALLAGNVLDFVPPTGRGPALGRVAGHLRPGGFLLLGCRTTRGLTPEELDALTPGAGLWLEHRFATWDLRPWRPGAEFCVSILRTRGTDEFGPSAGSTSA